MTRSVWWGEQKYTLLLRGGVRSAYGHVHWGVFEGSAYYLYIEWPGTYSDFHVERLPGAPSLRAAWTLAIGLLPTLLRRHYNCE